MDKQRKKLERWKTTAIKYAILTVLGIIGYQMAAAYAYEVRGYKAVGGEVFTLFLPVFYYLISSTVKDFIRDFMDTPDIGVDRKEDTAVAHVETWYRCPCGAKFNTRNEARQCAVSHIRPEQWAVGRGGKAVRIYENCAPNSMGGIYTALQEADRSDLMPTNLRLVGNTEGRNGSD